MKKLPTVLAGICLIATLAILGCTTTQKTVAYKTLYSVEAAVNSAHDAYLDQVVTGKVPTNGVPAVAQSFNRFQVGMNTAITAAQFNWTNPAPADVTALASDVLNAILKAKGGK